MSVQNSIHVTPEPVEPVESAITEVQDLHTRMAKLRTLIGSKPSKNSTTIPITAPCTHQEFRFAHNDYVEGCSGCDSDYGCNLRSCKLCGTQF